MFIKARNNKPGFFLLILRIVLHGNQTLFSQKVFNFVFYKQIVDRFRK